MHKFTPKKEKVRLPLPLSVSVSRPRPLSLPETTRTLLTFSSNLNAKSREAEREKEKQVKEERTWRVLKMMERALVPGDYTAIRASTINTHNSRCQPRAGRVGGGREVLKDETGICEHLEKKHWHSRRTERSLQYQSFTAKILLKELKFQNKSVIQVI